jgi:ADP-heptose:LPS heptosyltransferase
LKILVIRLSSIGDIVLTTPVVRCLKKQLGAEVHYLTKQSYYNLISQNPYIDKIHLYADDMSRTVSKLSKENYDLIIDLHHNLRTFIIKSRLGVKAYSFKKFNIEKWLLVNFKIDKLPDVHVVDRYMDTCLPLGITNDGEGLDHFIPEKDEIDIAALPPAFQNGYIAWAIGAKGHTKQFPNQKIINVLLSTQMPVILLGGKEDRENAKAISIGLTKKVDLYNAVGMYKLNQSASIVRQASLVVTNDTGLMHIAAAFKKKIISIWGNTITEFGMYPYYGHKNNVPNRVIEVGGLPCRPCSKIGRDHCPKGHFKCMKDIHEPGLIEQMNTLYQPSNPQRGL